MFLLVNGGLWVLTERGKPNKLFVDEIQLLLRTPLTVRLCADVNI